MKAEITRIGKRGTVVIPASLRQHIRPQEGDLIIVEDHGDGILLKPAIALPIEIYSLKRKAEFILSNAIDAEDYQVARKTVKETRLNPDKIPHYKPKQKKIID